MTVTYDKIKPSKSQIIFVEKLLNEKTSNQNLNFLITLDEPISINGDDCEMRINDDVCHIMANNYRSMISHLLNADFTSKVLQDESTKISMVYRGFMLDTARNKIINQKCFDMLIRQCATNHINVFQLYFEASVDYKEMKSSIKLAKLTWEQCRTIKRCCEQYGIEFVPSFPSLGHLYDLIIQKKYNKVCAINVKSIEYSLYDKQMHYTLDPTNEEALKISYSLIDQVIENLSPNYINMCGDETFDLTTSEFKDKIKHLNKSTLDVYQDFLIKTAKYITDKKIKLMMWTDVLVENEGRNIKQYFKDNVIGLTWQYHPQAYENDFRIMNNAAMTHVNCFMGDSCNQGLMNFNSSYLNMQQLYKHYKKYNQYSLGMQMTIWGDCGFNSSIVSNLPLLYAFNDLFYQKDNFADLGKSFCQKVLKIDDQGIFQLIQSATMIKVIEFKHLLFWYEQEFKISIHKIFEPKAFEFDPVKSEIANSYLKWILKKIESERSKCDQNEIAEWYFDDAVLFIKEFIINNAFANYIQKYICNQEVPKLALNIDLLESAVHEWIELYKKNWTKYNLSEEMELIPNIYLKILNHFKIIAKN